MEMTIRKAKNKDMGILADLAQMLWPEHTREDLVAEYADIINTDSAAFFVVFNAQEPVGFSQCQLRFDYVDGTGSSPVGYLENMRGSWRHQPDATR